MITNLLTTKNTLHKMVSLKTILIITELIKFVNQ